MSFSFCVVTKCFVLLSAYFAQLKSSSVTALFLEQRLQQRQRAHSAFHDWPIVKVLPYVQIYLRVEVHEKNCWEESKDDALAPIDVHWVGGTDAERGHFQQHLCLIATFNLRMSWKEYLWKHQDEQDEIKNRMAVLNHIFEGDKKENYVYFVCTKEWRRLNISSPLLTEVLSWFISALKPSCFSVLRQCSGYCGTCTFGDALLREDGRTLDVLAGLHFFVNVGSILYRGTTSFTFYEFLFL